MLVLAVGILGSGVHLLVKADISVLAHLTRKNSRCSVIFAILGLILFLPNDLLLGVLTS